jgi:hypothetical protein
MAEGMATYELRRRGALNPLAGCLAAVATCMSTRRRHSTTPASK